MVLHKPKIYLFASDMLGFGDLPTGHSFDKLFYFVERIIPTLCCGEAQPLVGGDVVLRHYVAVAIQDPKLFLPVCITPVQQLGGTNGPLLRDPPLPPIRAGTWTQDEPEPLHGPVRLRVETT